MSTLKDFLSKVQDFYTLDAGAQIKYFVYYLQVVKELDEVKFSDIYKECYSQLHINQYSNVSAYLARYARKGKTQQFVKKWRGYVLLATLKDLIDDEIGKPKIHTPGDSLYPLSIFENTRTYLMNFASEASSCYELNLNNACLVMLRKITETLIVELYENKGIESKIKTAGDDYLQLRDLINHVVGESSWKLSKTVKGNLPKIKLLADSSAHSRRFNARKADIDGIKTDLRIIFEELIGHIDYPKWHSAI